MNQTVVVSENAETVYHATNPKGWVGYVGHTMQIGELKFSIVPKDNLLIVSDYISGTRIHQDIIPDKPDTKEETIFYFQTILAYDVMMKVNHRGVSHYKKVTTNAYNQFSKLYGPNPGLGIKEETQ